MTKKLILSLLAIWGVTLATSAQKEQLLNGKDFSNWEIYIGSALKNVDDLKAKATPENVYSYVTIDGENILRISGEINASISTKEVYENYHLRIEFRWGKAVYTNRNSGLLYHSYGPFGAGIDTWMSSIELQLMHKNLGDAYMMANTYAEIPVTKKGDQLVYSEQATPLPFGNEQKSGKIARKNKDAEKILGNWNIVDLYCIGQKSIHVINSVKVMECMNTGKIENGEILPLTKGKIQIQSEGAELFIRKAEIEHINSFPENFQ